MQVHVSTAMELLSIRRAAHLAIQAWNVLRNGVTGWWAPVKRSLNNQQAI